MEYPELAARTGRFRRGEPRAVTVADDGSRVLFLRSGGPEDPADALWSFDVATGTERLVAEPAQLLGDATEAAQLPAAERALRERRRLAAEGIGSYATDPAARVAAFTLGGRLFRADLVAGDVVEVAAAGPALDAHPDPTGERLAYITDPGNHSQLRVIAPDGEDTLLAGEQERGICWGMPEYVAAEEFGRFRGYWWAPDGQSLLAARVDESRLPRWYLHDAADPSSTPTDFAYPVSGGANAEVSLHLLDLDGGWVDVHWDRETYPYLAAVHWTDGQSADHGAAPAAAARTGAGDRPAHRGDPGARRAGRPALGGADPRHPGAPARRAGAGRRRTRPTTGTTPAASSPTAPCSRPPSLYVRRVVGRLPAERNRADLLVEASDGDPGQQHLFRVRTTIGAGVEAKRVTSEPGWHTAAVGGDVTVIGAASLDHPGVRWSVWRDGEQIGVLRSLAATPPYAPRPMLDRVTDRRLPAAVLYPARARHRPQAAGAARLLRRAGPPGGARGPVGVAGTAVVGRRRVRRGDDRQPRYAGDRPVVREGDPPAGGRRGARRPDRRADRAGGASTPTWTWSGWRSAAGRSAAGWRGWRCCAARSCSAAGSPARR